MLSNEDTLSAIEELKKQNKNNISTEISDSVSSYLNGKDLKSSMSKYGSTDYKSNSNFDIAKNRGKNFSYSNLAKNLLNIKSNFTALNTEYINSQPTDSFIEEISPKLENISLAAIDTSISFDTLTPLNTQENINFNIIENSNYAYKEFDSDLFSFKKDRNKYIRVLNSDRKVVAAMSLISAIKSEINDVNSIISTMNPYELDSSINTAHDTFPTGGNPNWMSDPTLEDLIELQQKEHLNNWEIKLAEDETASEDEKESFKAVYRLKDGTRGYINSVTAALHPMSNLTAAETLADRDDIEDNVLDINKWWYKSSSNSSNISEAIYSIYNKGSLIENKELLADVSPGFDKWSRITSTQPYAGSLNSKSTIGLVQDILFNFKNGYSFPGNKLKAATVIGYKNYNISGRKTTSYISSNESIIPVGEEQDYSKFASGRLAAAKNNIGDEVIMSTHTANNHAIQAMLSSGPDFMANMFDVCIFQYDDATASGDNKPASALFNFMTAPNAYYNESFPITGIIDKAIPLTTKRMMSTKEDFFTRVQSISIPELKGETGEFNYLNQTIKYIKPSLDTSFESQLVIEQDADLEYMRLFNRLAGLSFKTKIESNSRTSGEYKSFNWDDTTRGGIPKNKNFAPNRANAGKIQNHAGYFGIAIKLKPVGIYNTSNDRIIVYEDVKFLGGGDISFKQSNPGLVTYTQKFIYKNVDFLPTIVEDNSNERTLSSIWDRSIDGTYFNKL